MDRKTRQRRIGTRLEKALVTGQSVAKEVEVGLLQCYEPCSLEPGLLRRWPRVLIGGEGANLN